MYCAMWAYCAMCQRRVVMYAPPDKTEFGGVSENTKLRGMYYATQFPHALACAICVSMFFEHLWDDAQHSTQYLIVVQTLRTSQTHVQVEAVQFYCETIANFSYYYAHGKRSSKCTFPCSSTLIFRPPEPSFSRRRMKRFIILLAHLACECSTKLASPSSSGAHVRHATQHISWKVSGVAVANVCALKTNS